MQLNLAIENMTCIHCAQRVENALRRVEGAEEAHVNLANGMAVVKHDPERAPVRRLLVAVRDEGFISGLARASLRERIALRLVRQNHRGCVTRGERCHLE